MFILKKKKTVVANLVIIHPHKCFSVLGIRITGKMMHIFICEKIPLLNWYRDLTRAPIYRQL